nr:MAG TPA: Putative Flagellin, Flp1-like, domain [Caudoviricetes sp.]
MKRQRLNLQTCGRGEYAILITPISVILVKLFQNFSRKFNSCQTLQYTFTI